MQALYKDKREFNSMPHLKDWLKIASPVIDVVNNFYSGLSTKSRLRITEEENILFQINNIQTYPFVDQLLKEGSLHLHGWYYDIRTGNIYAYNPVINIFEKVI